MMNALMNENEIRVLAVRQPWADMIIKGRKNIEVRHIPLNFKENVAIYASKYTYSGAEKEKIINYLNWLEKKNLLHYSEYLEYKNVVINGIRGAILGTVNLESRYHNNPLYDIGVFNAYKNSHLAPDSHFKETKTYFWHLDTPVKFETPIPYKPPKGAIVWSKTVLPEGY